MLSSRRLVTLRINATANQELARRTPSEGSERWKSYMVARHSISCSKFKSLLTDMHKTRLDPKS